MNYNNNKGKFDLGSERIKHQSRSAYQSADQVIDLSGGKPMKTLPGQNAIIEGSVKFKKWKMQLPAIVSSTLNQITIYMIEGGSLTPLATAGVKNRKDFNLDALIKFACYNKDFKFSFK